MGSNSRALLSRSDPSQYGTIHLKKQKLWVWKAICHESGRLLGWFCGRRDTKALETLAEIINVDEKQYFFTDGYEYYKEFFPPDQLTQSKRFTHAIERNNGRQRHWLAQFRRRSIVVSKSLDSLHRALALFARFRINAVSSQISPLIRNRAKSANARCKLSNDLVTTIDLRLN